MKKNYIIPFKERSTSIGSGHPRVNSLMVVDNVGLIVNHEKDTTPTDNDIRRHLIGISNSNKITVQAESLHDALKEFYGYAECRTGFKHKAWEIDDSEGRPVIEYSGCQYLLNDDFLKCQRYAEDTKVDNMYCVIDGLDDPPCDCPINNQKYGSGWRSQVTKIGGIFVKTFHQTVAPMKLKNNLRPIPAKK